jgi:hypothetical protein
MRSLQGCHHPIIEIRICDDLPGAFIHANILVDLWRAGAGPFPERLVRPSVEEINIEATLVFNSGRIEMGTILNFPTTLSL